MFSALKLPLLSRVYETKNGALKVNSYFMATTRKYRGSKDFLQLFCDKFPCLRGTQIYSAVKQPGACDKVAVESPLLSRKVPWPIELELCLGLHYGFGILSGLVKLAGHNLHSQRGRQT